MKVVVDGTQMPEAEGRAFWERFSAWMEEHRGDLAGFAAQEGYTSVHPGVDADGPVLRVSKTAAQQPYSNASKAPKSNASKPTHRSKRR
jgi:hypothetical protein